MKRLLLVAFGGASALSSSFAGPVINEILYRPGVGYPENTGLEFIEIHNPDAEGYDLSGWALTSGVDFILPPGTTLAAGGYLVIASDPAALNAESGLGGILGPWTAGKRLSNSGERITLSRADGSVADEVNYSDEGDWAMRTWDSRGGWTWLTQSNGGGASLERRNPNLEVDSGQNWGDSAAVGGSPGQANFLISSDIAPVIEKVKHFPAVPHSSESVTISCEVADEGPIGSVFAKLFWRDATTATPGSFQQIAMTNDGNGRFFTTLGAMPDKSVVEFYVQAGDGTNSRTWPATTTQGQTANCAYQVDDEPDSPTASTYRLVLTGAENADYETLAAKYIPTANISGIADGDRRFNATFVSSQGDDTTTRYRADMRIRGQSSRKFVNKPLRISFPNDDAWNGVTKFSLNPKYPWVHFMGMRAFQAAGLAGGDASPVEVRRNGEENVTGTGPDPDYGLWVRIEAIDSGYADHHWPEDPAVQLYRKSSGITNWDSNFPVPSTPDGTYTGWVKQNRSSINDWSDVVGFTELWQSVSAPHFDGADSGNLASGVWNHTAFSSSDLDALSAVVDFDQLARWLAVMTILNNREKNIATGVDNDYAGAWVLDSGGRRLQLVPHDMDNVMGEGDSPTGPTTIGLYNATEIADIFAPFLPLLGNSDFAGNPVFLQKYHDAIREYYGSVFDSDTSTNPYPPFHAFIDNHLGSWVPAAKRDGMKNFMTSRQSFLLGLIGAPKIVPPDAENVISLLSPASGDLRINEILAVNTSTFSAGGAFPDVIEIHNSGATAITLAGHVIADSSNEYVFPVGSGKISAGGYKVIHSETLGFGLSSDGDRVQLRNDAGDILDEVVFGPQLADISIARTATNPDEWAPTLPTINGANGGAIVTGPPSTLSINEWAGNTEFRLKADFVEIYNSGASVVSLGGLAITDHLSAYPGRHTFPPLSFIAAGGYLVADSEMLGFKLNGDFENIWLTGANGTIIRQVPIINQRADASTGLSPDGGDNWVDYPVPTPGLPNGSAVAGSEALFTGLRITEIMFEPNGGSDFEFVELQNIGPVTLSLDGVRFTEGINYVFGAGIELDAGDYVVICKDRPSFLNRYPGKSSILAPGVYTGSLSNAGEDLELTIPFPGTLNILAFEYSNSWYASTAGGGRSLHTRDAGATSPAEWGQSSTWTTSAAVHGSPGSGEPPVITSTTVARGIVGSSFSYVISSTGNPGTFTASGLPSGLLLDPVTGLISGSPEMGGDFEIPITATGSAGTADALLHLTVLTYGPLDHFVWDYAPSLVRTGSDFGVRISARDANGHLKEDYNGSSLLKAAINLPGTSPIMITEVTDGSEDQFELQNVTHASFESRGWFAVIGDTATISARNATTYFLPPVLGAGSLLRVSDSNSPGRIYFGADIKWNHTNPRGWIMLFDSSGELRDFVAFGQWSTGNIANMSVDVNGTLVSPVAEGQWSGPAIAGDPAKTGFNYWQRSGSMDPDSLSGWGWSLTESSPGSTNPGLMLPWTVQTMLSVTPTSVSFASGEFVGLLSIPEPGTGAVLTAADGFGHAGSSAPVTVIALVDDDEDLIPDDWEDENGLSSLDPEDAAMDSDHDGQSNLAEFRAGTDPQSASSVFSILSSAANLGGETYSIEWSSVAGKFYDLMVSDTLEGWMVYETRFAESSGTLTAELPTGSERSRFYRVEVSQ